LHFPKESKFYIEGHFDGFKKEKGIWCMRISNLAYVIGWFGFDLLFLFGVLKHIWINTWCKRLLYGISLKFDYF
jgi:hypothetical protein